MTPTIFPDALYVSGYSMEPCTSDEWIASDDPRGLLLMWAPPKASATYIMGLDPSEGITGWSRATHGDGFKKTDNGVIEIFEIDGDFDLVFKEVGGVRIPDIDPQTRRQKRIYKDVQVAEYAAPCDAVEIARVADMLGSIYKGNEEDKCKLIWEAWPGPGLLTTQELIRLGYPNVWYWQHIDTVVEDTKAMGWHSSSRSQQILWTRTRRHLLSGKVDIKSKWLGKEYAKARYDAERNRARAAYGWHDDRMQAANMCFWAGHDWSVEVEPSSDVVRTANQPDDYQRIAFGLDDYQSYRDWISDRVAEFDD